MSDGEFPRPYNNLAQRWRDLAERRRLHIIELYESGRWRHYYNEEQLVAALREATRDVEQWDAILSRSRVLEAPNERDAPAPEQPAPLQMLLDIIGTSDREAAPLPHSNAA